MAPFKSWPPDTKGRQSGLVAVVRLVHTIHCVIRCQRPLLETLPHTTIRNPKEEAPENSRSPGLIFLTAQWVPKNQAGPLGFEPRLTESESVVLPLHQGPIVGNITKLGDLINRRSLGEVALDAVVHREFGLDSQRNRSTGRLKSARAGQLT